VNCYVLLPWRGYCVVHWRTKAKPPANVITGASARRIRRLLDAQKLMAEGDLFLADYADDFTALADL
jgi:hypothetical protein